MENAIAYDHTFRCIFYSEVQFSFVWKSQHFCNEIQHSFDNIVSGLSVLQYKLFVCFANGIDYTR